MRLRYAVGLTSAVCVTACVYKYNSDEGLRRALRLYTVAGPVIVKYRWAEFKSKAGLISDEKSHLELTTLHRASAPVISRLIDELQGMYVKYAQLGSGLVAGLDPVWGFELRKLEDKCTPQPKAVVLQTIQEDWGRPLEEIFSEFDDIPLGSASIGQVHRAVLASDGKEVCVKVQYPRARKLFAEDISTIKSFLEIFAPEQVIVVDELARTCEKEFDYRIEASNLEEAIQNMTRAGFLPREVLIPRPVPGHVSERVLVMELLPGPKLFDGIERYLAVLAAREGLTTEELRVREREKIMRGGVPERYTGPTATTIRVYVAAVKWRDNLHNFVAGLVNTCLRLLSVTSWEMTRRATVPPPNTPILMDTLMRVHGTQLLVDGFFQADPHPGNFLLLT